ncbi:MAG: hypothetical protein M0T74_02305 [Desulfitobacterium hafniense]|nr:hypothetical protein [Desulfitobacterium hafniense]
MGRNDGNKPQKQELKKMELTLRNIQENERFLAENAGELTSHQIKDVKEHLTTKKKHLIETEGTMKPNY